MLISEIPANELDEAEADLVLWFGEPPASAGFSAPLAREEIVFIVHPDNPVDALTIEEFAALLRGEIVEWEQLVELDDQVTVWVYPEGNEVQQVIVDEFLQPGSITTSGFLAPDPKAMIEAVSSDQGAIGFLPRAWITEAVKSVEIAENDSLDISQPILALSENTPTDAVRTFLACLQSPSGQNVLERRYEPWID